MPDAASDESVPGSLRRMTGSVWSLVRTRLGIFVIELQEEKLRAIGLLVRLAIALGVVIAAVLLLFAALALVAWQFGGLLGVVALAVVTLLVAAILVYDLRRRILDGPQPFAGTAAEFEKDLECLKHD